MKIKKVNKKQQLTEQEIVQINEINKELTNINLDSFLLVKLNLDKINGDLYVCKEEKNVIGYVLIRDFDIKDYEDNLIFENKEKFDFKNSKIVDQIAISKAYQGKGYGKKMLNLATLKEKDNFLLSFIAMNPKKNKTSLSLHKKCNFKEIAIYKNKYFMGMKNYESALLLNYPT